MSVVELTKTVKKFIELRSFDKNRPILLAYSGGPDSKALLYGLLELGLKPHIAHVDHGWREESRLEAKSIEEEALSLNLPFYSTRLKSLPNSNLEEESRDARLDFFKSLYVQLDYQCLLLAHHADDLAETSLKRIFEGANLPFLGGMQPRSHLNGMEIWRPMLGIKKKEILHYLESKALKGFYDRTNDDPKFLRTRLRNNLLPNLATTFGKEIVSNLTLLSERAYELKEYLDRKIESIRVHKGDWGVAFHLKGVERLEARHILKPYISSRAQIESVIEAAMASKTCLMPSNVYLKKGWVVIFSDAKLLSLSEVKNLVGQFNIFLL